MLFYIQERSTGKPCRLDRDDNIVPCDDFADMVLIRDMEFARRIVANDYRFCARVFFGQII